MASQRHHGVNLLAAACGLLALQVAAVAAFATSTSADYRNAMTAALIFAGVATSCFAVLLVRGPTWWRVAGVLFTLPVLVVVVEFVRRFPHVFGNH